jgi:hypothetical protein
VTEYESTMAPGAEKRRSTRIIKSIPITVVGDDALGQPFRESTNTVMINCYGCKYVSVHYVPKNATVTVDIHRAHRQLPPRQIRGRVIWVQRPRSYQDVYHIGVEFDTAGNVWSLAAPPADWFAFPGDEEEAAQAAQAAEAAALAQQNQAAQVASNVTSFSNGGKRGAVAEEVLLVPAPSHAQEFEVDVTTELPHSGGEAHAASRGATGTSGSASSIRDRQTSQMREVVREIVDEKLNEHSVSMRRYFDDSLQQLLEKVYERMQKLQDESRAEMHSIREALTIVPPQATAAAKKPRAPRKRKTGATPVAAS